MPRTPNYNFERKERDRIKAAKKAEKLAAKEAKKQPNEGEKDAKGNDRNAGASLDRL